MPFYNFNYITDPPGDELVNEQTQLNDNWDKIENNYNWLQNRPPFTIPPNANLPVGLEFISSNRTAVWTGAAIRTPTSINAGWGAWTNLPMVAPYVALGGFTPQYRINTITSQIRLKGYFQNTASGSPFPKTAWAQFATIPAANKPINNKVISTVASSAIESGSPAGSEIAAARIRCEFTSGVNADLFVNWMGQDSGASSGNFVTLDAMDWWFA